MGEDVKRRYRSSKRAESAARTRARIREAAARLFVEKGYTGTRMKEVAAEAGVGERTLYDVFPTKVELFGHTLGVATVGNEDAVAVADRPEIRALREEGDPAEAVTAMVVYAADLLDRAGDLIMVSVEAAGADPDMRAATEAGAAATHGVHLSLTTALAARSALRPGLDAADAADILYALASPHMHQLLRRHRGWPPDRYRAWLTRAVLHELLGAGA
ncbi:TetR/AcrR family transcriptional regulator [Streptomyces vilmorinianum]|uniref:TetR/AcrR family transcriptional regulator n=1 Tax=Streptomyces vilmorinianum TaxID=3051092 RepID=UPI0015868B04|nr:TetR/AcrR family transcriptional regulator [Streptomyces vilmorinianum]